MFFAREAGALLGFKPIFFENRVYEGIVPICKDWGNALFVSCFDYCKNDYFI